MTKFGLEADMGENRSDENVEVEMRTVSSKEAEKEEETSPQPEVGPSEKPKRKPLTKKQQQRIITLLSKNEQTAKLTSEPNFLQMHVLEVGGLNTSIEMTTFQNDISDTFGVYIPFSVFMSLATDNPTVEEFFQDNVFSKKRQPPPSSANPPTRKKTKENLNDAKQKEGSSSESSQSCCLIS